MGVRNFIGLSLITINTPHIKRKFHSPTYIFIMIIKKNESKKEKKKQGEDELRVEIEI